ncbi:hypothetical protein [Aquabacterium sp. CECT 9606]|uniref:hypothetical protein n=1 Tax=Aquabacterium sp. CECT 9606 TaxID=2845822 RepID=UPI001E33A19F|nr:hypothetical protein [Aquabacterium sp. CECT 9606]CAH0353067.1 hypothetical protein AQB9606_03045 [Aquabacterium sp. CECT 9606]
MGKKLSPQELAIYRAVDEVLHYVWDPIGVSTVPYARDEYHGYLPKVFDLLIAGSAAEAIAAHLSQIVTERMGLSENLGHDLAIAKILLEWKEVIGEKHK